jgi:DNA-binding NarL/FixJ family response regulator
MNLRNLPRPARGGESCPPSAAPCAHVVVLDAHELTLRSLRRALQDAGFRVSATWSASEAVAIAERERPYAFVVASPGASAAALRILASPSVTNAGCVRVFLAPPATSGPVSGVGSSAADIVLPRDDALLRLPQILRDALAARSAESRRSTKR